MARERPGSGTPRAPRHSARTLRATVVASAENAEKGGAGGIRELLVGRMGLMTHEDDGRGRRTRTTRRGVAKEKILQ